MELVASLSLCLSSFLSVSRRFLFGSSVAVRVSPFFPSFFSNHPTSVYAVCPCSVLVPYAVSVVLCCVWRCVWPFRAVLWRVVLCFCVHSLSAVPLTGAVPCRAVPCRAVLLLCVGQWCVPCCVCCCVELVAVSHQSVVFPEVTVDTLVSLLQGRRVRQQ